MHVKRLLKRGLALCLAMAVAMPQAFASDALGSDLKGRTVELAPGVSVTDNSLWSATYSDLRTEYYVTYEPGAAASPLIWYGSTISSDHRRCDPISGPVELSYGGHPRRRNRLH